MVEIHTLSVADFKRTMKSNDLYDSNIEQREDIAVISIGDSFEDCDPDDIFSNGPSSRWFQYQHKNVLNLTFDDIAVTEKLPPAARFEEKLPAESVTSGKGYVLFDEEMAHRVVNFVEENREASTWIVHCSAGISRSGAVSRWLKDWLELRYGVDANNVDGRYAVPNAYVLRVLDKTSYQ